MRIFLGSPAEELVKKFKFVVYDWILVLIVSVSDYYVIVDKFLVFPDFRIHFFPITQCKILNGIFYSVTIYHVKIARYILIIIKTYRCVNHKKQKVCQSIQDFKNIHTYVLRFILCIYVKGGIYVNGGMRDAVYSPKLLILKVIFFYIPTFVLLNRPNFLSRTEFGIMFSNCE